MKSVKFMAAAASAAAFTAVSIFALSALALSATAPGNSSGSSNLLKFSYRVAVPAESTSCQDVAQSVAQKFASASSAQNVSGVCVGQQTLTDGGKTYTQDIVVVNYLSDSEVMPVKTALGGVSFDSTVTAAGGLFPSYQDCLSARATQLNYYTQYSGLTAIDSHCDSGDNVITSSWSLVIDGLGTQKAYIYGFQPFSNELYESYTAPTTDIIQVASQMIEADGGHIIYTSNDVALYYSSNGVQISSQQGPTFENATECTSQLSEAQKIFNSPKDAKAEVLCHALNQQGNQYMIVAVGHEADSVSDDYGMNSIQYTTFAGCMADRARVEQNLVSTGAPFYGTLCAPSSAGGYVMHVYQSLY